MDRNVSQIRWMGVLNILFGIWAALSPWLLGYATPVATASSVIFGTAIIIFSLIREIAPEGAWPSWINFVIGLWLIVSPFILQISGAGAHWNLVVTGILISFVSYANTQVHTTPIAM